MNKIIKDNKKSDELLEKIIKDVIHSTELDLKKVLIELEDFEKNNNSSAS